MDNSDIVKLIVFLIGIIPIIIGIVLIVLALVNSSVHLGTPVDIQNVYLGVGLLIFGIAWIVIAGFILNQQNQ
jgi:hypothetical protein